MQLYKSKPFLLLCSLVLVLSNASMGQACATDQRYFKIYITDGQQVNDEIITTKVMSALSADVTVSSLELSVETHNGVVRLRGGVFSDDERDKTIAITLSIDGVVRVESEIQVRK